MRRDGQELNALGLEISLVNGLAQTLLVIDRKNIKKERARARERRTCIEEGKKENKRENYS